MLALQKLHSAHRRNHSVETAVTEVYNDLIIDKNQGKDNIYVLLDLSPACDNIDQDILLNDSPALGIDFIVLEWFRKYLKNRIFMVSVNDSLSDEKWSSSGKKISSHLISYFYN